MNNIKLTKKELKRMAKDMGVTVEEIKLYIDTLREMNLINVDKNNKLTLPERKGVNE